MSKKLDITKMLDFSEMDMTPPNEVVEGILKQLPENTNQIIEGKINEYYGHVTSYTKMPPLADAFGSVAIENRVNIQDSLGKQGEKNHKYECCIYTSAYEAYKYRVFFMKYGIAQYPVQFTLEESIARSIPDFKANYIIDCNNREEVEDLTLKILRSKKVLSVMQELIHVFQAKKQEASAKPINLGEVE